MNFEAEEVGIYNYTFKYFTLEISENTFLYTFKSIKYFNFEVEIRKLVFQFQAHCTLRSKENSLNLYLLTFLCHSFFGSFSLKSDKIHHCSNIFVL